ncbi:MAG: hypothetical protein ACFE0R_16055 [Salinarimonas sp.]
MARHQERLEETAAQLPDLTTTTTAEAYARTGLAEGQIEALLATLDAARLADAAGAGAAG